MLTIQFNGKTNHEIGVRCVDPGRRQGVEEQIITYSIPNRDDEPVEHTGSFKPYLRPMIFALKDKSRFKDFMSWMQNYGRLYTSIDLGGFFKAHVVSQRYVTRHTLNYDLIQITFKINPGFFYLNSGDTPLTLTTPGSIMNPGTHHAEPLIKVTGSGNITLDINGKIIQLTGVVGHIYIDSESPNVYKETSNQGDKMVGDFPILKPGVNNISWSGTVTAIEIIPRWRDL